MLYDGLTAQALRRLSDLVLRHFNQGEADRRAEIHDVMRFLAHELADRPVWQSEVDRVVQGGPDELDGFVRRLLDEQLRLYERNVEAVRVPPGVDSQ